MSNSSQSFDGAKMLGALQLANPLSITSESGVLTLSADSNSFISGGTEAITGIVGGTELTQGIYVIAWNTVRTLTNSTSLLLISRANRTTAAGDVGAYQIQNGVTIELMYMPVGGYALTAHVHDVASQSANGFMSSTDKAKLDGIEAGAQVNQDAYSFVKVGETTIAASTPTSTIELAAGTNIALTPDTENKKITVAVTGKVASAVTADSVEWNNVANKPATFPPPIATASTLGGIKQGVGITIATDGTASVVPHGKQMFVNSGTFTVPAGVSQVWVTFAGGGGGGGGSDNLAPGGGGGGGAAYIAAPVAVTPGSSIPITVGAGGQGTATGYATAGGNSSFGSYGTALGGSAGGSASYGNAGIGGAAGGPGGCNGLTGGDGGGSIYGSGGATNAYAANHAGGYGGGGGGNIANGTISGNGTQGFVLVEY